jgi:hypothetical protein
MHAVFHYSDAVADRSKPAYQFAINDYISLDALNAHIDFYRWKYLKGLNENGGFTTARQLPLLRWHYLLSKAGNTYQSYLNQMLAQRYQRINRKLKHDVDDVHIQRTVRKILHEKKNERWACIACHRLIDLFLIQDSWCYSCYLMSGNLGEDAYRLQIVSDVKHIREYCQHVVDEYEEEQESAFYTLAAETLLPQISTMEIQQSATIKT